MCKQPPKAYVDRHSVFGRSVKFEIERGANKKLNILDASMHEHKCEVRLDLIKDFSAESSRIDDLPHIY